MAGLFEPFRRGSGERLDHGGGVGLGLTIARSIVTAHRAAIEARPNPDRRVDDHRAAVSRLIQARRQQPCEGLLSGP